jgi:hypothetical protein
VTIAVRCRRADAAAPPPRAAWRAQIYETPLHEAAKNGYVAICTALCERGADVNAKSYVRAPAHRRPACRRIASAAALPRIWFGAVRGVASAQRNSAPG